MSKDIEDQLRPLIAIFRQRRANLGLTARAISELAGYASTWATDIESGSGARNPALSRLAEYAEVLDLQEFGLYTLIDGHFTQIPIVSDGLDEEFAEEEPESAGEEP